MIQRVSVEYLAAHVGNCRARIVRMPPQVGQSIRFIDGEYDAVAAFLWSIRARGVAHPGDFTVESFSLRDDVRSIAFHMSAGGEVEVVASRACQAIAGIAVIQPCAAGF